MPIILYSKISEVEKNHTIKKILPLLPNMFQQEVLSYQHEQDQYACALGKLIIEHLLECFGYKKSIMNELKRSIYGKPFIENTVHFNVSHSFDLVVGVAAEYELGIDTELIRDVPIVEYKDCFLDDEWLEIQASEDPLRLFFEYWTKKESFLKAVGTGFSIPPYEIHVTNNQGMNLKSSQVRFFEKINLDEAYMTTLCIPTTDQKCRVKKFAL